MSEFLLPPARKPGIPTKEELNKSLSVVKDSLEKQGNTDEGKTPVLYSPQETDFIPFWQNRQCVSCAFFKGSGKPCYASYESVKYDGHCKVYTPVIEYLEAWLEVYGPTLKTFGMPVKFTLSSKHGELVGRVLDGEKLSLVDLAYEAKTTGSSCGTCRYSRVWECKILHAFDDPKKLLMITPTCYCDKFDQELSLTGEGVVGRGKFMYGRDTKSLHADYQKNKAQYDVPPERAGHAGAEGTFARAVDDHLMPGWTYNAEKPLKRIRGGNDDSK